MSKPGFDHTPFWRPSAPKCNRVAQSTRLWRLLADGDCLVGSKSLCESILVYIEPFLRGSGRKKRGMIRRDKMSKQSPPALTVQILCIGTDRSQQTVQTKIRLLLKKQSDQGLRCLPFHQHLLDALMQCYIRLFYFRTIMAIV